MLRQKQTLEQSISVREGQNAGVVVVWVGDRLKAKVGELGRNFGSAFRDSASTMRACGPQAMMVILRLLQNSRTVSSHGGFLGRGCLECGSVSGFQIQHEQLAELRKYVRRDSGSM